MWRATQAVSRFDDDGSTTSWSSVYSFATSGQLGLTAMTLVPVSGTSTTEAVFAVDYELRMISSLLNSSLAGADSGTGSSHGFGYIVEAANGKLIGSSAGEALYIPDERVSAVDSVHASISASAAVLAAAPYEWPSSPTTVFRGTAADGWQVHSRLYTGLHGLAWVVVGVSAATVGLGCDCCRGSDGRPLLGTGPGDALQPGHGGLGRGGRPL